MNKALLNDVMMNRIVALASLALIALPVGIACIILGFGMGDNPCALCWQERTAMVLVSLIALFITRYGLKPKYIGLLLLTAIYGLFAGYRHSSAHILRDIGQGFGPAIFGVHTYVWVMVVFLVVLLFAGVLLLLQGDKLVQWTEKTRWEGLNKAAANVFLVVIAFNIVQAFSQTGPAPFLGQGDPVRMSFNPQNIIWSAGKWDGLSKVSLRGAYSIAKPDFTDMPTNDATRAAADTTIEAVKSVTLPAEIEGAVTGISYNPNSQLFAVVTNKNWVAFLNQDLTQVLAKAKIDPNFSVEISNLAGVTFDSDNSVLVTADHKSFARVAYDPQAKLADYYANFFEGTDGITEFKRGRFETARAKYNYVGSAGFDAANNEYLMVTLPDVKRNNFVLVRLSGADFKLNSERVLSIDTQALPMVTGVVLSGDELVMLSQSGQQLLTADAATGAVHGAINLAEAGNLQALTEQDNHLLVVDAAEGRNQVRFYAK
ncbi:disulfide bond formation protein B [Ferrimonas balearica]|uniref:disulfide bond formation protein B n=1 Tax=Ferrimonas balearica TaxID=44012 RepID=UPI001C5A4147|nr:disulfide bond formation protein B [Ferrimonas balearica]MBW3163753.1 disulfide bond formation protein B [Ferrimonas balearica]MBY6223750.1 disulfide bond formation protein B [Ferrimonas balearica]